MVKNFARVMVAALFAVAVWGCDGNLGVEELVKRAEAHRAEGKPRAGIIELKNALQESPDNVSARLLLAELSLQIGDPFSAERELLWARDKAERAAVEPLLARAWLALGKAEQVLKEIAPKPDDSPETQATLLGLRGQALLATARPDEAEAELAQGKKLDAKAPQVLAGEAQLAWRRKDLAAARKLADEAARSAKLDYGIASLRADVLLAAGEAAEAESAWREVAKLSDNSVPARLGIARAEVAQKKYAEAIKELDAILKVAPRSPAASYFRALAAYMTKDYAGAKAFSEKALSGAGDHMPSVLVAGASSYALEQYEQANRYLQRYVAEVPENTEARGLLAQTLIRMGQPASARKTLEAGLKENPDDVKLLALVGGLAAQAGDLRASGNYLQKAVSLEPDNPRLRARLGATRVALGEKEGVEDLEKAIEIDPNFTQAEVALVVAELRAGRFREALERAEKLQEKPGTALPGYFFAGAAHAALRQLDQAVAAFNKVLELQPGHVSTRMNLAMIAMQQRQFDAARERLEGIFKDHPDRLDVMLRMAMLEQAANRGKEALSWLERAVTAHPGSAITHLYLSRFLLLTRDPAKAAETAASALNRFPKEPSLLEVLGQAQLALGRQDEAIGTFRTLVEVRPDLAQSHLLLAKSYGSVGDREKQRSALEKALAVQPDNPAARLEMARFLVEHRDLTKAQAAVDQLMKEFPNSPAVLELAGNLATVKGSPADAVKAYELAWQAAPSTNSTLQLATARWRAGDDKGALSLLEKWISENPRDVPAKAFLAGQYTAAKRYGDAKTLLTALVAEAPDSATLHNDLAWVLLKTGDLKGAAAHADRAVQLQPDNPLIMDTLAMILLEQDQTARAVDLLREASTRAAGNPTLLYHYALALSRAGKDDSARPILRDLIQNDRKFDERGDAETLLRKLGG